MLRFLLRPILLVGIAMTGAACQDDSYAAPRGAYQAAPTGYSTPYYAPAPSQYGYAQPAPNYYAQQQQQNYYAQQQQQNYYAQQQQGNQGSYNPADGRRYTTVTVTNRGQNGNRDDVVQQQVVCGSQYYDGYRNRTAPRC